MRTPNGDAAPDLGRDEAAEDDAFDAAMAGHGTVGFALIRLTALHAAIMDRSLTREELVIYAAYIGHMNNETRNTFVGRKLIVEETGYAEKTISNALARLRIKQFIVSKRYPEPKAGGFSLIHYTVGPIVDAGSIEDTITRAVQSLKGARNSVAPFVPRARGKAASSPPQGNTVPLPRGTHVPLPGGTKVPLPRGTSASCSPPQGNPCSPPQGRSNQGNNQEKKDNNNRALPSGDLFRPSITIPTRLQQIVDRQRAPASIEAFNDEISAALDRGLTARTIETALRQAVAWLEAKGKTADADCLKSCLTFIANAKNPAEKTIAPDARHAREFYAANPQLLGSVHDGGWED